MPNLTIADRLRRAMDERGMTFRELADESGMSYQHVHQVVSGTNPKPNILIVERLAEAIGVTMFDLYAYDSDKIEKLMRQAESKLSALREQQARLLQDLREDLKGIF